MKGLGGNKRPERSIQNGRSMWVLFLVSFVFFTTQLRGGSRFSGFITHHRSSYADPGDVERMTAVEATSANNGNTTADRGGSRFSGFDASSYADPKAEDVNEDTPTKDLVVTLNESFAYNRERWNHSPRIVLHGGPHKAASTSMQYFLYKNFGTAYSVAHRKEKPKTNKLRGTLTQWVWPEGRPKEYASWPNVFRDRYHKFHANLGWYAMLERQSAARNEVGKYLRMLLRRPLEEGKRILLATENFDFVNNNRHYIDDWLELFPWDNDDGINATNTTSSQLQLNDVEVVIHHRTSRLDHSMSLWHEVSTLEKADRKFRDFLLSDAFSIHHIDSMNMALSFVQRGIQTTIVDMGGVQEKDDASSSPSTFSSTTTKESAAKQGKTIIKGLEGAMVCDILLMGQDKRSLCDDKSWLYLDKNPNHQASRVNVHPESRERGLSDPQQHAIAHALEEHDCSVWQRLKKYQPQGLLRVLHPSKHLFEICDPEETRNISPSDTMDKIRKIASE